jgi:8-oxo-dGTP diphosphatase
MISSLYKDVSRKSRMLFTDTQAIVSVRPSIYGILVKDNKILLIEHERYYNFPGGGVSLGESPLDALRREFIEETGLIIEPVNVLCATKGLYTNWHKPDQQLLGSWWSVNLVGGTFKPQGDKKWKEKPVWVFVDKIPVDQISQFNQECLTSVYNYCETLKTR